MKFLIRVLSALALGIGVGFFLGSDGADFANSYFAPLGKIYLNLLKMMIMPMVFTSLVAGVCSLDNLKKLGRIGGKTFGIYMTTTFLAMGTGIIFSLLFQPGAGLNLTVAEGTKVAAKELGAISDILVSVFPSNPFKAFVEENMIQVIVFSLAVGVGIVVLGEKVSVVKKFFEQAAEVCFKIVTGVIQFTPIGVFGLTVPVVAQHGAAVFLPLIKFVVLFYVGIIFFGAFVYGGILFLFGINPLRFYKYIMPATVMAFSVRSSGVTMPVTLACCQKMNISKAISSFVIPLGATINMDGTAVYEGFCALFVAQVYGIDLSFAQYVLIILSGTLASIGTATVPSASFVMLTMVLTAVGLPLEGTALIAGIDVLIDMPRTALNTTGDAMVCSLVAKSEGENLNI